METKSDREIIEKSEKTGKVPPKKDEKEPENESNKVLENKVQGAHERKEDQKIDETSVKPFEGAKKESPFKKNPKPKIATNIKSGIFK